MITYPYLDSFAQWIGLTPVLTVCLSVWMDGCVDVQMTDSSFL